MIKLDIYNVGTIFLIAVIGVYIWNRVTAMTSYGSMLRA